jgi:hypothetical protein
MLRVGFEPMAPVFERAKAVVALYRAATVTGSPQDMEPDFITVFARDRYWSLSNPFL